MLTALILLLPAARAGNTGAAADRPVEHNTLARSPDGIGIGAMLGLPIALSVAWKPHLEGVWGQGQFGWDFTSGTMAAGADVLYTLTTLHAPDIQDFSFPFYVGVGPRLRLGVSTSIYAPSAIALRVPVGMCFYHTAVPIEGFLEAAPSIGLAPGLGEKLNRWRGGFDFVIGGRFFLP